jgi:hypothetical protein
MYEKWFRYGDVEVANNVRVSQYVKNGLKPTGAFIQDCGDCGDLPTVVDGVPDYRTPELDFAPWVLGNDSDAGDFAGVFVKEVVGLDGSTNTVDVEEKVGDGGAIGTRRAASRTVAVTADVVARTREAASLGLEWLAAALHPPCSPGGDCAGGVLHMFTTCPVACVGQTDPDAAFVTTTYSDASMFQTTGLKSTNAQVRNYIINPSAENATLTTWGSNAAFGAYVVGTTTKQANPSGTVDRANVIRLATPALTTSQRTNITAPFTVDVAGTYEFSCWVYIPAATNLQVRACNIFAGGGPYVAVKDKWIRLSYTQTLSAGDHWVGIDTKEPTSAQAAGQFIYMDAAMFTRLGGLPSSGNFQGALATDVDGWGTQSVFGNFTPAASIALDNFTGPSPGLLPRSLKITWGWPSTGTTGQGWAGVGGQGLVLGQVYTYECDVYVPTGSPDVIFDVTFNGQGQTVTTKDTWVHVKHTFVNDGFTGFAMKATPTGAGQVARVANVRLVAGFGTMQPLSYFDGATPDDTTANLAAGVAATIVGAGTLTPGVIGPDGNTWTRFARTGPAIARVNVPLASLTSYREYYSSWLVLNDSAAPVTLTTDWADVGNGTDPVTLQSGESRRVYARGARTYDATFRYTDIELTTANTSILYRDVRVEAVAPYDFAWTGTAETTASTATPLGDDFIFKPNANDSTLYGPVREGVCDDVTVSWTVSSPSGVVFNVQVGWATEGGEILGLGPLTPVGATPIEVRSMEQSSPGFPNNWRPVLVSYNWSPNNPTGQQVTIHSLEIVHRPVLSVEECVKPYRRTLHNVVTVEGPKVVEWLTLGDDTEGSTVARVEWTWVATDPHVWHDPIPLLTSVVGTDSTAPVYQAPGVPITGATNSPVNTTACARPALTAITCADNTVATGIVLPPQAPVLADAAVMNLAGTNRTRRAFEIPTDISPIGLGKLSWKFVNDGKPKFGIRVRIWRDTIAGFLPEVECNFLEEFTVEYLAPNQTLFIDGPGDDAYTLCGIDVNGDPIYAPALRNLRGNYGGPFKNSWIGCGSPYYVAVEVPNTYTNVPTNISGQTTGTSQGSLVWSVDLVRRG